MPTGNFGDIFAGYIAKRMGLPIDQLVVATNQNDILHRCLTAGGYAQGRGARRRSARRWIFRSVSNFERALFDAYGRDGAAVAQLMDELKAGRLRRQPGRDAGAAASIFASGRASEDETCATIAPTLASTPASCCARIPPSA